MTNRAYSADATNKTDTKRYQLLIHEVAKLIKTNPSLLVQQLGQFQVALPTTPSQQDLITAVSNTIQHNKAFAKIVWNDIQQMEGGKPGTTAPSSTSTATKSAIGPYWQSAAGLGDILNYGGDAVADMGKIFGGNNQAAANVANSAGASAAANQAAANTKNQNAQNALNDSLSSQKKTATKSNTIIYVGAGIVVVGILIVVIKMAGKKSATAGSPAPAASKV